MGNLSSPEHLVGHLSQPQTLSGHLERGASQTTIDELTKAVKQNLAAEDLLVTEEDRTNWDGKSTTEETKEALENENLLVSSEDREFWDLGRLTCFVNPENPKNLVFTLREKE